MASCFLADTTADDFSNAEDIEAGRAFGTGVDQGGLLVRVRRDVAGHYWVFARCDGGRVRLPSVPMFRPEPD